MATKKKTTTKRSPKPKVTATTTLRVEISGQAKGNNSYDNWHNSKVVATRTKQTVELIPHEYGDAMCTKFKFNLKDLVKFVEEINKEYKLVEK